MQDIRQSALERMQAQKLLDVHHAIGASAQHQGQCGFGHVALHLPKLRFTC